MNLIKYPGLFMILIVLVLAGVFNDFVETDLKIQEIREFEFPEINFKKPNIKLSFLNKEVNQQEKNYKENLAYLFQYTSPNQTSILEDQSAKEELELFAKEAEEKEKQKAKEEKKKVVVVAEPAKVPASTPPPTPIKTYSALEISPKSLVALRCRYTTKNSILTEGFAHKGELISSGSGVIIHPDGYVLTSRRLLDPFWINKSRADDLTDPEEVFNENREFDYCEVGFIRDQSFPSRDDVLNKNLEGEAEDFFPYVATTQFIPSGSGLSGTEDNSLDFAILKITRAWDDCALFDSCGLPASFSYAPSFDGNLTEPAEIMTYGFQDEMTHKLGDLTLKGSIGTFKGYKNGNQYFSGAPLSFLLRVSRGLREERVGSAVFWNGYLVGIVSSLEPKDFRNVNVLSISAVKKILTSAGRQDILKTE